MVSSRAVNAQLEADREDAWHLPLSLEEGRWSPTGRSPGSGSLPLGSFPRPCLGGSRPRLLGYSDGFAPDSHRLPFSALLEPPIGRSLLVERLAGTTSPKPCHSF